MQHVALYFGSVAGSALLMLVGWWRINCAVTAENLVIIEDWERY